MAGKIARCAGWLVYAIIALATLGGQGRAETRVALVIGNSQYASVGKLDNPGRDASLMAKTLESLGFQTVQLETNLGLAGMVAAVRRFEAAVENADWAVVYFAGHGIEIAGTNYLIPTDAQLKADRDAQDEALPLDRILSAVEPAKKLRLIILDACRNNPFASQMRRTSAKRSIGRGLASIEPGAGVLVAYAAKHGEVAEDGTGPNSQYVLSLVARLKQPGLELNRVFRAVHDDVLKATNRRQEPYTYGALPNEDFYFKRGEGTGVGGPLVAAPGPSEAAEAWLVAKESSDPAALEAFLRRFGDTFYGDLARNRLKEVKSAALRRQQEERERDDALQRAGKARSAAQECDQLAANPYDLRKSPDVSGVSYGQLRLQVDGAISACQTAAESFPGEPRFTYQLARSYQSREPLKAAELYQKLSRSNYPAAHDNLGWLYVDGRAGKQDVSTAIAYFRRGADLGDPDSMMSLAGLIVDGRAASRSTDEAYQLYQRAATAGHKEAYELLQRAEQQRAQQQMNQQMFMEVLNLAIGTAAARRR